MAAQSIQPPVTDLVFEVHGQPMHPEFFDILAVRQVRHADFLLTVQITRTGHVISWDNEEVLLTELTASITQELPRRRRLLHYRLGGERSASLLCAHGIQYQAAFHLEKLRPELFAQVEAEIVADGKKRGMLYHQRPQVALDTAPVGLVFAEFRPGCLFLTTFHTFPEEHCILKTQSLIEKNASPACD